MKINFTVCGITLHAGRSALHLTGKLESSRVNFSTDLDCYATITLPGDDARQFKLGDKFVMQDLFAVGGE